MTKRVLTPGLIVLLFSICSASLAFAPDGWMSTYGGPGPDEGYSVQQTTDGGYIIVGYTYSFGAEGHDVYLIKTDASGDTLWTRTCGGTGYDEGRSVQETTDGGYIIAGYTSSFGAGGDDVYLVKTNASGDTLWTRTYGGTGDEDGYSVQQTSDGGYVVAGCTESFGAGYDDAYLIKTDASGDTMWTRTYGSTMDDGGFSVQQTADGGFVVTGLIGSAISGKTDVWLIKTDAHGATVWTRTFGGENDDAGYSVQQTSDSGYIIAGYTWSFGAGYDDVYLIKTDASGDTLWTRTCGGTSYDEGYSVQQTSDGGYIITGYTYSFGAGDADVYLIKTDSSSLGVREPLTWHPANPSEHLPVQPNPFTSLARVPGHGTELFALSDITGRRVALCRGDRIGEGLRPGVYFVSPVGLRTGKTVTATIVKAAF